MTHCGASSNNEQDGGAASDFSHFWHSMSASPAELSRVTLKNIDKSPMFNPLQHDTIIPTGTSGVIPTGIYLSHLGGPQKSEEEVYDNLKQLSQQELQVLSQQNHVPVKKNVNGQLVNKSKVELCKDLLNISKSE